MHIVSRQYVNMFYAEEPVGYFEHIRLQVRSVIYHSLFINMKTKPTQQFVQFLICC